MFLSLRAQGLSLLSLAIVSSASTQAFLGSKQPTTVTKPFASSNPYAARYDDGLFTPVEHLSTLSVDAFTALSHPVFPNYSVRIKKSDFCDGTVNAYTGYIDIQARHLFFYFFESRNDPATDDVIFWTNGGPGCSSSLGLFMELGPCRALTENGTTYHPESWNTNANLFFIDQPIGVGFSYADYGETVSTTEEAAKDIAAFVAIFFENFSQFKGRPFHMAGESYGGRYLPVFAAEVYDQNAKLVEAGLTPINLQSVMIGNGMTDYNTMIPSYIDMQCTAASVFPISSIGTCVRMKQALPRCQKWTLESCINQYDTMSCGAARDFCNQELQRPFSQTGMNPYDISKKCEGDPDSLCYPVTKHIRNYLRPSLHSHFARCRRVCYHKLHLLQPRRRPCLPQRPRHEPRNLYPHRLDSWNAAYVRFIYIGTYDWICNWVGNERWTFLMPWTGQEAFVSQPLREWEVDGHVAGKVRSAGGLTFATIDGAGHMVPYDKPKEALALVQRWLAKTDL
ncbi:serine carboxypeptidase [Melanogaster broomeanus]|nr:serine carboxypeptidase [Melanogaster broomeanus]